MKVLSTKIVYSYRKFEIITVPPHWHTTDFKDFYPEAKQKSAMWAKAVLFSWSRVQDWNKKHSKSGSCPDLVVPLIDVALHLRKNSYMFYKSQFKDSDSPTLKRGFNHCSGFRVNCIISILHACESIDLLLRDKNFTAVNLTAGDLQYKADLLADWSWSSSSSESLVFDVAPCSSWE